MNVGDLGTCWAKVRSSTRAGQVELQARRLDHCDLVASARSVRHYWLMSHREHIAAFWDKHVDAWLDGEDPMVEPLRSWWDSYKSNLPDGKPTRDGFVEPFQGDLLGQQTAPAVVVLGLNPGMYYPEFQSRSGIFADEIRSCGSYTKWAATTPYVRDCWEAKVGKNRYQTNRLNFARAWTGRADVTAVELLIFELYPWHSARVKGAMQPPAGIINDYVWEPISELPLSHAFAFGRRWSNVASDLGLRCVASLGAGGVDCGFKASGRAVRVYELKSDKYLVVHWCGGGGNAPGNAETAVLRSALLG